MWLTNSDIEQYYRTKDRNLQSSLLGWTDGNCIIVHDLSWLVLGMENSSYRRKKLKIETVKPHRL